MLTRIDHVMICVPDLQRGIDAYTRIGFHIYPGGAHTGRATHNAIAFHQEDYLELLSLRKDRPAAAPDPGSSDAWLAEFLARGGGFRYIAVQSDDLAGDHPNEVLHTDRVYIVVPDVAVAAETYGRVLGLPVPKIQRGTVIKADMAVFDLGPTGLTVAQPVEAGPAAEALARTGPGPFQVLYRTGSMDAAARWMASHGVPPPARGVRNTGEQVMLVGPEHACGAYIGFVGSA